MSGFGDVPCGAERDPRAPWNEKDEETTIICPTCGSENTQEVLSIIDRAFCMDCGDTFIII